MFVTTTNSLIYIQGLDNIMEAPGNFKQIYFYIVASLSRNQALCRSLFRVLEETGFSRWSLSSAVIFGAVFLGSFQARVQRFLSDCFRFLPEFCLSDEGFPSFSNAVITFETVLLAIPNNSSVFDKLAPALRAPTIWPLLKSDRTAILMKFDQFLLMISVRIFRKIRR